MSLTLVRSQPDWVVSATRRIAASRETILVASGSHLFADVIAAMVIESGFTCAFPTRFEAPSVSVTRTQPSIVICDCECPVDRLERLIFEATVRRVPLLMSHRTERDFDSRGLRLLHRVAWVRLPLSLDAFRSEIDSLLQPLAQPIHRLTSRVARGGLDPRIRVRALSIAPRVAWTHEQRALVGRRYAEARDQERADDDGMALARAVRYGFGVMHHDSRTAG